MTPMIRARTARPVRWAFSLMAALLWTSAEVLAHGVSPGDQALIQGGRQLAVFSYLGAKHMVTGYDHLLFLFGVIFFLYRLREVGAYVTNSFQEIDVCRPDPRLMATR